MRSITSFILSVVVLFLFVPSFVAASSIEGAVSLTFDDANASQFEYVYPILNATGQKGVVYTPTGFIEDSEYMSWDNLSTLHRMGWEIGGHTVYHEELPAIPRTDMIWEINQCFNELNEHGLSPANFATPFGAYNSDILAEIAKRFDSQRGFHEIGYNKWPYNKYYLHIRYIDNQTTLAEVESWIEEALANDYWIILSFHEVLPVVDPSDTYSWSTENLEGLMAYLNNKGVKAQTLKEVLNHTNILSNGSFEQGFDTWATRGAAGSISINTNNMGSYPFPKNSVKMVGNSNNTFLFGPNILVDYTQTYGVRFFENTSALSSGELGFYIDEYDAAGNWISGQWKGKANLNFVIDESYQYSPTSAAVEYAALQVYLLGGSVGTAYIDGIEFFLP